ncbi:MAG: response regulator transcription factor [Planctomycetota bacterium]|nr:response regulator transcription factor [Planctomycetota bacterium]
MKQQLAPRATPPPIRVLCVDDNTDMLDMMQMIINAEPTMQCIGCLKSADKLIQTILGMDEPPQVILLDATMPGKDPLLVLKKMSEAGHESRTLVLSGYDDAAFIKRTREAGAWGFVSKSEEPQSILQAVRNASEGKVMWPLAPLNENSGP